MFSAIYCTVQAAWQPGSLAGALLGWAMRASTGCQRRMQRLPWLPWLPWSPWLLSLVG